VEPARAGLPNLEAADRHDEISVDRPRPVVVTERPRDADGDGVGEFIGASAL
jgi:hypothetical protein